MKWVTDDTGRFRWRPYYDAVELDLECEQIVASFQVARYGEGRFPVSTDDLTVMIERDTSALDLYADIAGFGENIEGLTDFFPQKKPVVKIAAQLSLNDEYHHRLRLTLAHEYGHVRFHTFLWEYNQAGRPMAGPTGNAAARSRRFNNIRKKYLNELPGEACFRCRSTHLLDAPYDDWMEWQASYACGAFLMPYSAVKNLFTAKLKKYHFTWVPATSGPAAEMTGLVSETFDVSEEAASVRLRKLGYLQQTDVSEGFPVSAFRNL